MRSLKERFSLPSWAVVVLIGVPLVLTVLAVCQQLWVPRVGAFSNEHIRAIPYRAYAADWGMPELLKPLDSIKLRYEPGGVYGELLISNYDTRGKARALREQLLSIRQYKNRQPISLQGLVVYFFVLFKKLHKSFLENILLALLQLR